MRVARSRGTWLCVSRLCHCEITVLRKRAGITRERVMLPWRHSSRLQESNFAILAWGCAHGAGTKRLAGDIRGPAAGIVTSDTQTRQDDTTAEPKRRFKFPTAFTVLFFVLVLVWILTFIIKP